MNRLTLIQLINACVQTINVCFITICFLYTKSLLTGVSMAFSAVVAVGVWMAFIYMRGLDRQSLDR